MSASARSRCAQAGRCAAPARASDTSARCTNSCPHRARAGRRCRAGAGGRRSARPAARRQILRPLGGMQPRGRQRPQHPVSPHSDCAPRASMAKPVGACETPKWIARSGLCAAYSSVARAGPAVHSVGRISATIVTPGKAFARGSAIRGTRIEVAFTGTRGKGPKPVRSTMGRERRMSSAIAQAFASPATAVRVRDLKPDQGEGFADGQRSAPGCRRPLAAPARAPVPATAVSVRSRPVSRSASMSRIQVTRCWLAPRLQLARRSLYARCSRTLAPDLSRPRFSCAETVSDRRHPVLIRGVRMLSAPRARRPPGRRARHCRRRSW